VASVVAAVVAAAVVVALAAPFLALGDLGALGTLGLAGDLGVLGLAAFFVLVTPCNLAAAAAAFSASFAAWVLTFLDGWVRATEAVVPFFTIVE